MFWHFSCLFRWALVKALIELWPVLTIDYSRQSMRPSFKPSLHCSWWESNQALNFFFSFQIQRLTNNSSFFGCNQYDADLFALAPWYCLSPTLIGMNCSVSKVCVRWLCQCEPHFSERRDLVSQPSPIKHAGDCLQEALENGVAVLLQCGKLTWGKRHGLGLTKKITTFYLGKNAWQWC